MRYLFRNFHVFVFAFVSVFSALIVANGPEKAVGVMQPLVEDAIELQDLTVAVYREVRQVDWETAADEAVSLAIATMRMPSMLFERLADRIEEVERDMSQN